MLRKRLSIALTISVCLVTVLVIAAERSHQATAAGVIDPSCTSSLPCIEYDNNGSGPGIRGISLGGNGLAGATKFNSTSLVNSREGLIGNDVSTSGSFNAGVRGLSVRGFGVAGQSTSGSGVSGISTSGSGVTATSTSGEGLNAVSTNLDGVVGRTFNPSNTSHIGVAGVDGLDSSSDGGHLNVGVLGTSTNGFGVSGLSTNFVGVNAVGGAIISGTAYPALSVNANGLSPDLIDACNTARPCTSVLQVGPQFEVITNGDVFITGFIFTAGSCNLGCAPTASSGEKRVRLFTPQESLPTVEDFGEAQLVGGRTYVRIDPAFANTMDNHAAYMVVITPEGDSNGLYVANKTAVGFEVHENRGGRSTLAFSYRIVAKPFGEHPVRLQMITVSKPGTSLPPSRVR